MADEVDDPWQDPGWLAYAERVIDKLVPMIQDSAVSLSIIPKKSDVKFATELGLSIMLDKPIIAVVTPGTPVPAKMIQVADAIVEGDFDDPSFKERLHDAIKRAIAKSTADDIGG